MSSAALAPTAVSRPAVNPWLVATAVVIPTFMEILDTTIANVPRCGTSPAACRRR